MCLMVRCTVHSIRKCLMCLIKFMVCLAKFPMCLKLFQYFVVDYFCRRFSCRRRFCVLYNTFFVIMYSSLADMDLY